MSSNAGMSASQNSPAGAPSLPSPLSVRDFRVFWIGQFISLVGMWTQMMAQGIVVTELTRSASVIAWISLICAVPMWVLIMPAGVLADKRDRRKILIVTQILLAMVAFAFAGLVWGGHLRLYHVFFLGIAANTIAAFDFPAQQALVPQLVPAPLIPKAVALNQAIFHGSRIIGPALAGLLIYLLHSKATAFLANGLSYFAVIYSLVIIPSRPVAAAPARKKGDGGMAEAIRYVRAHPIVLALIGLTGLVTAFVMPISIVFMPLICKKVFESSDTQMMVVMAASGVGAVIGSFLMLRVPAQARGKVIFVCVCTATLGVVTLSYAGSIPVAAVILSGTSFSTALALGLSSTTIQVMVPNQLRGRVMGLYGMTFVAIMPPFAVLWGYLGDFTSLHVMLVSLGLGFGTCALTLLAATGVWRMNPAAPPAEEAEKVAVAA
jgi:MFS family permease